MDSNVSKNTFSHKFFKLRLTKEKTAISVKYLLKQELLQTLVSYRQQANISLDLEFIANILERKIILFQPAQDKLESKNQSYKFFSESSKKEIAYSCPIAFTLAPYFLLPTQIIAQSLLDLLVLNQGDGVCQSSLQLRIQIVPPGWLNFYLEPQAIAEWLSLSETLDNHLSKINFPCYELGTTLGNLFPVQYVHARCCCLLRLGAREKLITLKDDDFNYPAWQLSEPQAILWSDEQQNLWFTSRTEYSLLRQLLIVTDSFMAESNDWVKLAWNLGTMVEVFLTDSRFLGKVRQKNPAQALARLGLIALSQYWLQRILLEKLKIAAPTSL